ncbi:hypothetical protein F4776DRAFT_355987 [Hypoxylon sp. NC0597]|nr:hypothetical protein F4776DRAFT_355987 [Hypoxylon sp. NC0597]
MADYYVRVRDYHWSHQNTVVQSPILDLNAPPPAPIVRPLEGIHRHEPRIIDNITDLRDDIQSDEYRAEAHGVFVLTDPRNPNRFPVWVPVQSYKCKAGEVYIVNLTSCEASSIAIAKICWVPGLEGPDGSLYTVIGCPRETLRATKVMVLVQKLGLPREAKLVVIDPTQLAEYGKIEDSRKKALFEIQTRFIRTRSNPPSCITLNVCRILTSPDRNNRGRLGFDEVLDEDPEVPWASHSDCSSQSSFSSSGDDDSPYVKPTYVSLVRGSNVSNLAINHTNKRNDEIRC